MLGISAAHGYCRLGAPDSSSLSLTVRTAAAYEPADRGSGCGGWKVNGGDQLPWQDAGSPGCLKSLKDQLLVLRSHLSLALNGRVGRSRFADGRRPGWRR
jgi:hypothetical protein